MLTGRSVEWRFVYGFALLAGCRDAAPADDEGGSTAVETTSTTDDGTTGDPPAPLHGIADLHLHMFAEEGFGGGWFHGSHKGEGDVALAPCDGGEPGDHARFQDELAPLLGTCEDVTIEELSTMVPIVGAIVQGGGTLVGEFVGSIPGSDGDTGLHTDRTHGWPDLAGWPRWDAIAHQQVWEQQLREAYDAGLRLTVISAVSLDWLCLALADENVEHPECDEMADVKRQLELAHQFDADNDWVEVALTPADAHRIVGEDKLAFVLSVEASHLMRDGAWQPQLDELFELGVRTLQPVHQLDNRFGGAAPHNTIFQLALYAENCHIDTDCGLTTNDVTLGFDVDADCRNTLGLTPDGRELVQAMMDRGMLVDAAHLSEKSVRDLYDIAVTNEYYPLYISHGHFREIMVAEKQAEEKTTPAWAVQMLRETGGMIGLRTAHEETDAYEPSAVANTCHGSSRSFAQAYDYGRLGLQVAMGLGSDLNGFIQQTRPRFGPDACSASFPTEALCQARDERASGVAPLGRGFDEMGLGHIGLLVDLLDDLDALGSDSTALRDSADDFVRMWERASSSRSGPVATDPMNTDGIVEGATQQARLAEFPLECGEAYCPGGTLTGERCRFDAECESGTCEGAGECGMPLGICS